MEINKIILIKDCNNRDELCGIKNSLGRFSEITRGYFSTKKEDDSYHELSGYNVAFIHESDAMGEDGVYYNKAIDVAKNEEVIVVFFSGGVVSIEKINSHAFTVSDTSVVKYGESFLDALSQIGIDHIDLQGFDNGIFVRKMGTNQFRGLLLRVLPLYLIGQFHEILFHERHCALRSKLSVSTAQEAQNRWQNFITNPELTDSIPDFPQSELAEIADGGLKKRWEELQQTSQELRKNICSAEIEQWSDFVEKVKNLQSSELENIL